MQNDFYQKNFPLVSVIIPVLNEEKFIVSCIQSIQRQKYTNYEIIVVDNGSTDRTASLVKQCGVHIIEETTIGLPRAREKGRQSARGDILIYIDADSRMPPDYLTCIVQIFEEHPSIVAISNSFYFYDGDWKTNLIIKCYNVFLRFYIRFINLVNGVPLLFGGSFAVRRGVLQEIDGFNTEFQFYGEDTDLAKRIARKGQILFLPHLLVATSARRFVRHGLFKTSALYLAHYFSVLLFNKPLFVSQHRLTKLGYYAVIAAFTLVAGFLIYAVAYPTSEVFGKTFHALNSKNRFVALTFDDGPNGEYTQLTLDILDQHHIKATFFLIGKNVESYPEIAKEIVRRGHEIGNHSYSHEWRLPFENKKSILDDVDRAEEVIYQITGKRPKFFRPPHGWRTPWFLQTLKRNGYTIVMWSDSTLDWTELSSVAIAKTILAKVKPGAIIMLHDGINLNRQANRQNMVEALKIIIKKLEEENYQFVPLKELEELKTS